MIKTFPAALGFLWLSLAVAQPQTAVFDHDGFALRGTIEKPAGEPAGAPEVTAAISSFLGRADADSG